MPDHMHLLGLLLYPGELESVVARDGFGVTMGDVSSELVAFSLAVM